MTPCPKPAKRSPRPRKPLQTRARLERRTPLPRPTKPIARTWMVKRRARRIDRETPAEKQFKADVHALPCVGIRCFPPHLCRDRLGYPTTRVEQSHERSITKGAGMGVKQGNRDSAPKCGWLAQHWDNNTGPFKDWKKAERLAWMADRIAETQAAVDAMEARRK